jgi:hypothetical protein
VASYAARGRPVLLPALTSVCVFAFAAGSSSFRGLKSFAGPVRWVLLFVLLDFALLEAAVIVHRRGFPKGLRRFVPLPIAFVVLTIVSAGWSFEPRVTVEHAISLAILLATVGALSIASDGDPLLRRRLLTSTIVAAGVVATIGLLMLAAGINIAAQPSTPVTPWRFRGFGENPNTVALLAAIVVPVAAWAAATSRSVRARNVWCVVLVLLVASVVIAQSRGAEAGMFVGGSVVLGVLIERWPRKLAAIAAFAAPLAVGLLVRHVTQPAPPPFVTGVLAVPAAKLPRVYPSSSSSQSKGSAGGNVAGLGSGALGPLPPPAIRPEALPARSDEYGHPAVSPDAVTQIASGRIAAWRGALALVGQRPLLGYGFGTESQVFVDRYYSFQGDRPENSIIGVLLQLGVIGLALMVGIAAQLAWFGIKTISSACDRASRAVAALGLGTLAAAMIVGVIQSYLYAAGNIAVLTLWLVVFLAGAEVMQPRDDAVVAGARTEGREAHAH